MDSTTWEAWERASVVEARDLRPGDVILAHPESGPFGPWEVREVRGAYMSTSRVDVVSEHHTWFGAEGSQSFRVERAS
jgi:hypothetical protein